MYMTSYSINLFRMVGWGCINLYFVFTNDKNLTVYCILAFCCFLCILVLWLYFTYEYARLVEETLEPLDPDRRAFRLVGGVLVSLVSFVPICYVFL